MSECSPPRQDLLEKLRKRASALALYLRVPVESGVMQGGAPPAVGHINAGQHGDDDLGAAQGVVG